MSGTRDSKGERFAFDDKHAFVAKLRELVGAGVGADRLRVYTPFHVHETDELIAQKPSGVRYFTLAGAASGLIAGFALTIWTSLDWPLRTGGKPIVSLLPYLIIGFELTILIGALVSFLGFLILGRFPSADAILMPNETGNQFVIEVDGGGGR